MNDQNNNLGSIAKIAFSLFHQPRHSLDLLYSVKFVITSFFFFFGDEDFPMSGRDYGHLEK